MKKLLLIIVVFFAISCKTEADYEFIGEYPYKVSNDSLLENTYLSEDSYGYVITDFDLSSMGIEAEGVNLKKNVDYLVSINRPVTYAYKSSPRTRNEGMEHVEKKPLDARLDTTINTKKIYVYELKPKGMYRLMLP